MLRQGAVGVTIMTGIGNILSKKASLKTKGHDMHYKQIGFVSTPLKGHKYEE